MHCGIGSCGVPRPSVGGYVTVMNPLIGRPPPEGLELRTLFNICIADIMPDPVAAGETEGVV